MSGFLGYLQLDANIDEASFQLLDYSFLPMVQIIGNVVRFNFANINLPDSVNNEPGSHGYVQYKVRSNSGLANNSIISNTAFIYFDFNPPIQTNIATTNINCSVNSTITVSICSGESFYFNDNDLTVSGIYLDTIHSSNSCDTIIQLELTTSTITTNVVDTICNGDAYLLNGNALTSSGIYIDTIYTTGFCDTIVHLDLTVTSQTVNLVQTANSLNILQSGTYQWYDCISNSIISNQSNSYFTPTSSGSYAGILINGNCRDTSACVIVIISSINEKSTSQYSIIPNPVNDKLFVNGINEKVIASVYDVTGRIVKKNIVLSKDNSSIGVAELSKGVYVLEMYSGNYFERIKFVKE